MRAIYSITNITNDKKYIGETMDVKRRWEEHEENLDNNKHHSYKLQEDWNIYGADNFKFDILSVLDESISNYIDKYVLLIYEGYYMIKYDSIDNGYNIENTLEKVLNDEKFIFNKDDSKILKKYYTKVENGNLINYGGLIFMKEYLIFKDLCDKFKIDGRAMRKLMMQENIIVKDGKKYSLSDNYGNNSDIIMNNCSDLYKMKFTKEGVEQIYNKLNNPDNFHPSIIKENKEIFYTESEINNNSKCTFKQFLSNYKLNVKYAEVFEFLREKNILEYIIEDGKNNNYPTKNYKTWFVCESDINPTGTKFIRIYLTEIGKIEIYKILYDNLLISNADIPS